MKKQISIGIGAVLAVVLILGVVKYLQISAAIAEGASRQPPPTAVTSMVVEETTWPVTERAVGSLRAVKGALLSAEDMGRVAQVEFESGSDVKEGQLLLRLDSQVEEAELDAAKARLNLASIEAKRQSALRERNANAKGDLDSAQAKLQEAKAEVARIEAMIRRRSIVAPFDGKAGVRLVNLGQMVNAGEGIVSVQAYDPLFVDFNLPQQSLSRVREGLPIKLEVEGFQDKNFTGTLTAIDSSVDSTTRNFQLQGTISNSDGLLRPGMFVEVVLEHAETQTFITVPISSIKYAPYGDTIFVIENAADNAPGPRPIRPQVVKLGPKRGDVVAVLSGLKPGEEVVTSGVFKLRPDGAVIVNNETTPGKNLSPTPENT